MFFMYDEENRNIEQEENHSIEESADSAKVNFVMSDAPQAQPIQQETPVQAENWAPQMQESESRVQSGGQQTWSSAQAENAGGYSSDQNRQMNRRITSCILSIRRLRRHPGKRRKIRSRACLRRRPGSSPRRCCRRPPGR